MVPCLFISILSIFYKPTTKFWNALEHSIKFPFPLHSLNFHQRGRILRERLIRVEAGNLIPTHDPLSSSSVTSISGDRTTRTVASSTSSPRPSCNIYEMKASHGARTSGRASILFLNLYVLLSSLLLFIRSTSKYSYSYHIIFNCYP